MVKIFKNFNFEKVFVGVFVFLLIFPMLFFGAFGVFLDWSYFKRFNFYDFSVGEFQENFNNYFKDRLPFYSKLTLLKPSVDILTGQVVSSGVFLQENELTKISKLPNFDKAILFVSKLNKFLDKCSKPCYLLIVPAKLQVTGTYLNSKSFIDFKNYIFNRHDFNNIKSKIISLDESVLFDTVKEVNSFYRTSNRLNGMGGYLLYSSNMTKLGQKAYDLDNFKIVHAAEGYFGELYNKNFAKNVYGDVVDIFKNVKKHVKFDVEQVYANGKTVKRDTIYDLSKIKNYDKTDIVFGDGAVIKNVETNLEGKEKVLIFADETINSMMQFLAFHYKKLTVVNLHDIVYSKGEILSKILHVNFRDYDRILFIYGVESFVDDEQFRNLKFF